MRPVELLRSQIAYSRWANDRLLETALPLLGDMPAYAGAYGELPDTILHILQAQETWMARWRRRRAVETEAPRTEELLAAYTRSHDELEELARALTDEELERPFLITFSNGAQGDFTLGQQIAHLLQHSAYHRGEAALLLTRAGRSPGDLDYLDYLELL
jgi:uncharacterized damage-inducible protein DinB